MRHTKVAIVGAGAVGSTIAYSLILNNVAAEIMLIDINEERCKGEVLDLSDALAFSDTSKIHQSSAQDARESDIIIICAGTAQKPGQPRTELININKKIVTSVIKDLTPLKEKTIIIVVTNPVDAMTFFAQQASNLPKNNIFGSGTFLDTQRLKGALSKKLHIAEQSIQTCVIGEHGDSQVPTWSSTYVGGKPVLDFPEINKEVLDKTMKEVRQKAYEIINCKGATFFGIASCVSALCESVLFDQKKVLPVSVFMEEFGVCLGIPAIIGRHGVEEIVPVLLNKKEKKLLELSAKKIRETIGIL